MSTRKVKLHNHISIHLPPPLVFWTVGAVFYSRLLLYIQLQDTRKIHFIFNTYFGNFFVLRESRKLWGVNYFIGKSAVNNFMISGVALQLTEEFAAFILVHYFFYLLILLLLCLMKYSL